MPIPRGRRTPVKPGGELPVDEHDLQDLHASGLNDATIRDNGLYTERDPGRIARMLNLRANLSWPSYKYVCGDGALVFPYRYLSGRVNGFVRLKPRSPRFCDGKPRKYEQPLASVNHAFFPAASLPLLQGGADVVFATEGEKKSLFLSQLGLAAVGIGGVWNWKLKGEDVLIPDLAAIPATIPNPEGADRAPLPRAFCIVFDYDKKPVTRREVYRAATRFADALREHGWDKVCYLQLPPGPDGDKQGVDDFLLARGEAGYEEFLALVEEARPIGGRVKVFLSTKEYRVTAQAERALADRADGLYQRGQSLVQVVEHQPEPGDDQQKISRPERSPVARSLPSPLLRELLSRHVDFVVAKTNKDGTTQEESRHVPGYVVSSIAARGHWRGVPQLHGIVSHPVIFADGTILKDPGFDPQSGLLLWMPKGLEINVWDHAGLDEARRAMAMLHDVVGDFPFLTPAHRSAFVAALLTPLARYAFNDVAPLFFADGNTRGVGKGLLMHVIARIVLGRDFPVLGYTNDPAELDKRITAIALAGDEMVLFDNIVGQFGNAELDRALTGTTWEGRILGQSQVYKGPLHVTWYATGNNVFLAGDISRRLVQMRLESPLEHPEKRGGFKYPDLKAHVLANRGQLLSACLTILRAYLQARWPAQGLVPWGSYEAWSGLIREAIVWCGEPDPGDTRTDLEASSSPQDAAVPRLLAGILAIPGQDRGVTVKQIVDAANPHVAEPRFRALYEALITLCPGRGNQPLASVQSISMKLHNLRGRIADGMKLERFAETHHSGLWRVVLAGGGTGRTRGTNSCQPEIAPSPQGGTRGTRGTILSQSKNGSEDTAHPYTAAAADFGMDQNSSPSSPSSPSDSPATPSPTPKTVAERLREKLKK
jgi:hypothetical protein